MARMGCTGVASALIAALVCPQTARAQSEVHHAILTPDLDGDGLIDTADLRLFDSATCAPSGWCPLDFDGDGDKDDLDRLVIIRALGRCSSYSYSWAGAVDQPAALDLPDMVARNVYVCYDAWFGRYPLAGLHMMFRYDPGNLGCAIQWNPYACWALRHAAYMESHFDALDEYAQVHGSSIPSNAYVVIDYERWRVEWDLLWDLPENIPADECADTDGRCRCCADGEDEWDCCDRDFRTDWREAVENINNLAGGWDEAFLAGQFIPEPGTTWSSSTAVVQQKVLQATWEYYARDFLLQTLAYVKQNLGPNRRWSYFEYPARITRVHRCGNKRAGWGYDSCFREMNRRQQALYEAMDFLNTGLYQPYRTSSQPADPEYENTIAENLWSMVSAVQEANDLAGGEDGKPVFAYISLVYETEALEIRGQWLEQSNRLQSLFLPRFAGADGTFLWANLIDCQQDEGCVTLFNIELEQRYAPLIRQLAVECAEQAAELE
jgi:hypothetical protein